MTRLALVLAGVAAAASLPNPFASLAPREKDAAAFFHHVLTSHARGNGPFALKPPPLKIRKTVLGFRLADDLGCGKNDDPGFCAVARPKAWTDDELKTMTALLEKLENSGLKSFLDKVRENGFDTLVRESVVAHFEPGEGWRPLPYPNSLHTNRLVVIADHQFEIKRAELSVIHLFAHAYDFSEPRGPLFYPALSHSPEFLKLAGFALDAQGRWQFAAMAPDRRTRFLELFGSRRAELLKLNLVHGDPDGWKREKEARKPGEDFAAAYRAPSFHSLLNPYESFAEWTALAQLEPQKAEKINPELTRWLKEKVLAGNAPSAAALARAAKVPIADVHLHLEKSFTPSALRAAMDRNGVRWAGAVGPGPRDEAPSDFRSAFQKALGSRYIATLGQPELGSPGGLDDAASPALKAVLARADDEFKAGSLKGFGELFVNNMTSSPEPSWKRKVQADSPAMRALYAAAAAHGGFLQIHMEADPDSLAQLERLLSIEPRAAVILSHCALNATAAQMLPLMASHPNLYCELSHRSPPTLSGPRLAERKIFDEAGVDAAWLSVIESMPDRFMVGTDAIGSDYDAAVASLRRGLLARLSPAAMRKVADENAKRVMRLR